jgi:hypothetical protein
MPQDSRHTLLVIIPAREGKVSGEAIYIKDRVNGAECFLGLSTWRCIQFIYACEVEHI